MTNEDPYTSRVPSSSFAGKGHKEKGNLVMRYIYLAVVFFTLATSSCSYGENAVAEKVVSSTGENHPAEIKPNQPVAGFLNGRKMVADWAEIDDSIMTIRQGDDFFAQRELKIFTFSNKPLENSVIDSKLITGITPHIYISWRDEGDSVPKTETLMGDYELTLSFGKATELGMPYTIMFKTDKFKNTQITGNGIVTFKDSAVNRSFNSFDTLDYIAREFLKKKGGETVTIVDRFEGSIQGDSAYIGIEYRQSNKPIEMARLQFRKFETGWKVVNQLADNQLRAAHLYDVKETEVGTQKGGGHIGIVAARLVEDEYNKLGLVPLFRATDMRCSLINGYMEGNCEYSFKIKKHAGIECNIRNIHLKYLDGKWKVLNEMDLGYRYDFTSGKIIEDKYGNKFCRNEKQ